MTASLSLAPNPSEKGDPCLQSTQAERTGSARRHFGRSCNALPPSSVGEATSLRAAMVVGAVVVEEGERLVQAMSHRLAFLQA